MSQGAPTWSTALPPAAGDTQGCSRFDATHWDEALGPLGFERLCGYDFSHTGLTWMADAGVPIHHLRKIAGHGSLTTTPRYLNPGRRSTSAV